MRIDPVEIWLSKVEKRHSGSDNTAQAYRRHLERFCQFMGSNPIQIVEGWKAVKYDLKSREHYIDEMLEKVDVFENHLGQQGLCRSSVSSYLSSLQSFFKYMRIPVALEVFNAKPTYHNRDITKEEVKLILNNSTPRDKAFYLAMLQSGLRPVTLTKLTYAQIKTDFEANRLPCLIDVLRNMTKGEYSKHFSFIGHDAVKALRDYFNQKFRGRGKPRNNERVFGGVTPNAFSMRFGYYVRTLKLIKPEEMRPGRKPQQLRLYCLRKYFRKWAGAAGQDYAKFWMGETLGVDDHYFTRDPEHHRKVYEEKAMPMLRIFESSALETEQTIMELRRQLDKRDREIAELRQKQERLDEKQEELNKFKEVLERSKTLDEAFVRFKRLKDKEFETG